MAVPYLLAEVRHGEAGHGAGQELLVFSQVQHEVLGVVVGLPLGVVGAKT